MCAQSSDSMAYFLETTDTLTSDYKANAYRKLAEGYLQQDTVLFDKYINLALENALAAGNFKEVGYSYLIQANHCYILGKYDCAVINFRKVGSVSDTLNDTWFTLVKYNGIGVVHFSQSRLDTALTYYLKAQQTALASGDTANGVSIMINIGGILRDLEKTDSAETVYKKAVQLAIKTKSQAFEMQAYINLSNINVLRTQYSDAYSYASKAYRLSQKVGDPYYVAEAQKLYGVNLFWMDSLGKSRNMLSKSRAYYKQAGNGHGESDVMRSIALVQAKKGHVDSALNTLRSSRSLDSTSQHRLLLQQSRAKVYELAGEGMKALRAYKVYKSVYDSLINEESLEKLSQIQEQFESEKKQRIIAEQTTKIQSADLQIARRNVLLGLLLGLLLLGLVAAKALMERRKRKLQAEKDIAVIQEREKGLEAVILAQEEERKRIGADLHDGITQNLGAISLKIQHLSGKQEDHTMVNALDELNGILNASIAEVRTLSHQMRPYALENYGLKSALGMLLESSLSNTSMKPRFEELRAKERYPEKIEITLYRIAQELLNNTIKHSGATEVSIQLIDTHGYLLMIVEDNGKGMNEQEGSAGQGLLNIKSRLNSLKGDVDLDPSSAAGTSVIVRIPLG